MKTSYLGKIKIGLGETVKIISIINISPESFYQNSVVTEKGRLKEKIISSIEEGASIIDLGGMSTAPYKSTFVSEEIELERVLWALNEIKDAGIKTEISIDTQRSSVMAEALKRGATIINDVSGLSDRRAPAIIKDYSASLILCAAGDAAGSRDPISFIIGALSKSLNVAERAGIERSKIVIDPAIGFFRNAMVSSYDWDSITIANLGKIKRRLGMPVLVGVSRKSFIGLITKESDPDKRLSGSLAATAIAVLNGADAIRTHDVAETAKAVKVAEYIRSKISFKNKIKY